MRILGIDPGLQATGYGLLEVGHSQGQKVKLLEVGMIAPKRTQALPNKIEKIYKNLDEILNQYSVDVLVLEKLYSHYKRPTVACIMGHARGVICLLCAQRKIQLVEHSVKRIRKTLVGNGNATKQQTRETVAHLLGIQAGKLTLDASDALALALGYAYMQRLMG